MKIDGGHSQQRPGESGWAAQRTLGSGGEPEHRQTRAHHAHRDPFGFRQPYRQHPRGHDRGDRQRSGYRRGDDVDGYPPQGHHLQHKPEPIEAQADEIAPLPDSAQQQAGVDARPAAGVHRSRCRGLQH